LCEEMSKEIEKRFGHQPPMMLRTLTQMEDVVRKKSVRKAGRRR
jgi:hypothetical protein